MTWQYIKSKLSCLKCGEDDDSSESSTLPSTPRVSSRASAASYQTRQSGLQYMTSSASYQTALSPAASQASYYTARYSIPSIVSSESGGPSISSFASGKGITSDEGRSSLKSTSRTSGHLFAKNSPASTSRASNYFGPTPSVECAKTPSKRQDPPRRTDPSGPRPFTVFRTRNRYQGNYKPNRRETWSPSITKIRQPWLACIMTDSSSESSHNSSPLPSLGSWASTGSEHPFCDDF